LFFLIYLSKICAEKWRWNAMGILLFVNRGRDISMVGWYAYSEWGHYALLCGSNGFDGRLRAEAKLAFSFCRQKYA
jgi:hypothetical protein